ncbi:hypothetical protein [Streptomyces sp. NPDC048603]|uniref:hypothetical protein n=1 Tax=Streptomyces sp. NPDC048603 TaxID=3365577 RepID=UPI00371411FA
MFPSIPLAQEIGLAVLFTAAVAWLLGLGHMLRDRRFHHPEPATAAPAEGLPAIPVIPVIPGQRTAAAHPMESVELTEAEKQAFAGLVRRISPQR